MNLHVKIYEKIRRKLNCNIIIQSIVYFIFISILVAFWIPLFYKAYKNCLDSNSDLYDKENVFVIIIPILVCTLPIFINYIFRTIKQSFVVEIDSNYFDKFEIVSLEGKRHSFILLEPAFVKKAWDYPTSYYFFKLSIGWIEGQNEIYQLIIDKRKFYIMPNCFEDKEGVYNFLQQISELK